MDRLVSIPERDSNHCFAVRGRKPASTASEISIPERDLVLPDCSLAAVLPSCFNDTGKMRRIFEWSSHTELIKLKLAWWRQPSSTESEIRCTRCLHPSGARPFYGAENHHSDKLNGEYNMENHEQLLLFDLQPYTVELSSPADVEDACVEVVQSQIQLQIEYVQLELDLFPQPSYPIPLESCVMAA